MESQELDKRIGATIQRLREKQGMNQTAMVRTLRDAGIEWSQATLSKVEAGTRPVRLSEVPRLAQALGASGQDIMPASDALTDQIVRAKGVETAIRGKIAEARDELHDIREYLRALQLLREVGEGRPGPYTVGCTARRFLLLHLEHASGLHLSPMDALRAAGVADSEIDAIPLPDGDDEALAWDEYGALLEKACPQITFAASEESEFDLTITGLSEDWTDDA